MNLPEGCELTYYLPQEQWYADTLPASDLPQIGVVAQYPNGGCEWEFYIHEHTLGGQPAIQVRVFYDAFEAFAQVPELFGALARNKWRSLATVRWFLEGLGVRDATKRVSPYAEDRQ